METAMAIGIVGVVLITGTALLAALYVMNRDLEDI